ncbi:18958_t:CDS:2 [Funneliformis geosporum]|uniref:9739_t:CDS:1 n=1 Tax=Funneliformis geosporum TaxID=1117311 RepID=A0A9W4WUQ7_9GLOM|nr:18958_t:CDS:2 [Funneliformis geosporum]CAI2165064.1 9739_t:CDS:2 [Funneliformis geosporum]
MFNNNKRKEKPFKREFLSTTPINSNITQSTPTSGAANSSCSAHQDQGREQQDRQRGEQKPLIMSPARSEITISPGRSLPRITSATRKTVTQLDPISLKNSLDEILGINKEKYWSSIQSFVKGELNKVELDLCAHSLLSKEHVHLHDKFIRASIMLKNTCKKNQNNVRYASSPYKEKSLEKIMSSIGKEERDKLCVILKRARNNQATSRSNPDLMLFEKRFPKNVFDRNFVDHSQPLTSSSSLSEKVEEISEFDSIYTKMTEIALDNGLIGGVSEDCANLMIYALESHLKSIVHDCIIKIRSDNFHNEQGNSAISLNDLAFSLEISPYILVENNFMLEKIRNSRYVRYMYLLNTIRALSTTTLKGTVQDSLMKPVTILKCPESHDLDESYDTSQNMLD